jgi:hypothetical protein
MSRLASLFRIALVVTLILGQSACVAKHTIRAQPSDPTHLRLQLEALKVGSRIAIELADGRRLNGTFRGVTETELLTVKARYPLPTVLSVNYQTHDAAASVATAIAATVAGVMLLSVLWVHALKDSDPGSDE